jgi:hypothetical protein
VITIGEHDAEEFRASALVPLVAFPEAGSVLRAPELEPRSRRSLDIAVLAVRHLHGLLRSTGDSSTELEEAHILAVQAMRWVVESLSPAVRGGPLPPADESPVHAYFGVRQGRLSAEEHAGHAAAILFRSLADTRYARIDVNDLCAEVGAIVAVLERFAGSEAEGVYAEAWAPPDARPSYEPAGRGLERWVLVHHEFFLLNLCAAAAVAAAAGSIRRGADDTPVLLREACVYVRGFTAAMAHSGAFSAGFYEEVVRPTMQPPATPFALTGAFQPEHASYRAAVGDLLEACPEPFGVLAHDDRELALARDELLEADLVDIERHALIAAALVGPAPSLVQGEESPENAVGTLRRMRDERAVRYARLMRFGGRSAARLVAARS